MIKNYLLAALRNIKKFKGHSLINLVGLGIGLAVFILIWQFISYQESFDEFHENGKNIYRLDLAIYKEGKLNIYNARGPLPLGPTLKEVFPEVVEYARLFNFGNGVASWEDVSAVVSDAFLADNSFLTLFSFPLVKGNPKTALAEPNSAVISESAAKRFFRDQDPMGKVIRYDRRGQLTYIIKGVFKDVPANSHLHFDFLFSIHHILDLPYFKENNWGKFYFYTYVSLNANADPKALGDKVTRFIENKFADEIKTYNVKGVYLLRPLADIYLYSPALGYKIKHFDMRIIYFLSIIAIFILIIAWINYINLCTARSLDRAREVSIKKVVGSTRFQLIKQFMFESLLFNVVGALLALLIVKIAAPTVNQILGIPSSVSLFNRSLFWLMLTVLLVVGSLLSGLYPAFVLSSFKPITVLRGKLIGRGRGINLRKILVVFQLVISIVLLACTVTVYKQVEFMKNKDLGVDTHQVLLIRNPRALTGIDDVWNNVNTLKEELLKYPGIVNATLGDVPGKNYDGGTSIAREGSPTFYLMRVCWMDPSFIDTFQLKLLAGRDFSVERPSDRKEAVIINETAMNLLGFKRPGEALDQIIIDRGDNARLKIIGVMKNYYQTHLREPVRPAIFRHYKHFGTRYFAFKLNTENVGETVALVTREWKKAFPGNPVDYIFLDDLIASQYKIDNIFGEVFRTLSLLAVFIACIGVFGLFAHATLQRTKEIGIRKVFGAEVFTILGLLLKDLTRLLVISILIAFPIAYFLSSKMLEFYANRIGIGWWFFVIPVVIIIPFILIATAYHVVKAASENPVKSLRYE